MKNSAAPGGRTEIKMTHAERMNSNTLAEEYLDSWVLRYRYIDNVEPNMDYEFLGMKFSTPILAGGFGMHKRFHESGHMGLARAVEEAGSLNFNGWMDDEQVEEIAAAGIRTIRGVKPFADHDRIYQCIDHDTKAGAVGICMDIDHIFEPNGKYSKGPMGQFGRQTVEDLKGYVRYSKIPFILKGVLTREDAEKCLEIGPAAIIVTNHNNRFPDMVPPLAALPEVKEAVNGAFPVLVDGCLESGVEAFKAFALGADGVCVCRPLMNAFHTGGPEAVTKKLNDITAELAGCMANTGADCVAHISRDSLMKKTW